ncbi:MAG: nitroreductase family deazaflavin-dependent oxidoreductase [Nocardia sp.]|uniref:hypothetical protein n=1 Tax=Nocardia sp. TaxID=1821 RepID=UPI0026144DF5|nr:hypothetical protein [Nocardia sp.]MCU1647787.1 nitroreductase family deazaflavin-dependent oxidoreductase [Nocardia sp.]
MPTDHRELWVPTGTLLRWAISNSWVTIELGDKTFRASGHILEGAEYDEFADRVRGHNQLLAGYQAQTTHPIPLVVLTLGDEV